MGEYVFVNLVKIL